MGRRFFLDMNAFFASVEQQENPALRGRPLIVVPLKVPTTCAIAASYEAKAFGIRTGTQVSAARRLCPDLVVVEARPLLYVQYHRALCELLQAYFVSIQVLSIDEMVCGIGRTVVGRTMEEALAHQVKQAIKAHLGAQMRCSIGIGPNTFLAKVACERQKPDGLTIYDSADLPDVLFTLELTDLPGIAKRMLARLNQYHIRSVRDLYEADVVHLRRAWGSVVGVRWYWMLRGSLEVDYGQYVGRPRKSVSCSHVLPPEFRDRCGTVRILLRLCEKALKRLREEALGASCVEIRVDYRHRYDLTTYSWRQRSTKHLHANEESTWLPIVRKLLDRLPPTRFNYQPMQVSIGFSGLLAEKDQNLSLFEAEPTKRACAARVVDMLEAKGLPIARASLYTLREQAPYRIPFGVPPHPPAASYGRSEDNSFCSASSE